jgi:hypothetical protein
LVGIEKKFDWINFMEENKTEENETNTSQEQPPVEPLPNFFETIS